MILKRLITLRYINLFDLNVSFCLQGCNVTDWTSNRKRRHAPEDKQFTITKRLRVQTKTVQNSAGIFQLPAPDKKSVAIVVGYLDDFLYINNTIFSDLAPFLLYIHQICHYRIFYYFLFVCFFPFVTFMFTTCEFFEDLAHI